MASFIPKDQKGQLKVFLGLLALVGGYAYYQFVYTGRADEVAAVQQHVDDLNMRNDAMRAIVARHGTELPKRLAIYEEHVRQLEQLIPRREDVPFLINQITRRAYDLGVELAGLSPGPEEAGEFYSRQSYDMVVLGQFHNLGEYFAAIGSLPRIIRSRELKLSVETPEPSGHESPQLRAIFRIETYIMPSGSLPAANLTDHAN